MRGAIGLYFGLHAWSGCQTLHAAPTPDSDVRTVLLVVLLVVLLLLQLEKELCE